jgi:hypothetical protein
VLGPGLLYSCSLVADYVAENTKFYGVLFVGDEQPGRLFRWTKPRHAGSRGRIGEGIGPNGRGYTAEAKAERRPLRRLIRELRQLIDSNE